VIGLKRRNHNQPGIFPTVPTTLTVLHPKGGVGRSTTVYMLGAELALRGHRVALIDRDQGQHLSRVFDFYPPAVDCLVLGEDPSAALRIPSARVVHPSSSVMFAVMTQGKSRVR
jgi:hypothetical protein